MKHYFNPMSRAVPTDWMLKELDAPHEQIVIDFSAGENNTPEYRAINPMGKVPTLVDGDAVIWTKASPKVEAYVERLRARPAYQASHASFG